MKSVIASSTLFGRTAKRLEQLLPSYLAANDASKCDINFKDATAYVLGHANFRAHNKAVRQADGKGTPRDEDLTSDQLRERRIEQAHRLEEYMADCGAPLTDNHELIGEWQPTAARPQRQAITVDGIEQLREADFPQKALEALLRYERTGDVPTQADLDLFYKGLKSSTGFTKRAIPLWIGPLAVSMANKKTGEPARVGFALLEMLSETRFTFAKVQLAQLLVNGWGTSTDLVRARALCEYTDKALTKGEHVFDLPASHIDFLMLKNKIWSTSPSSEDRLHALECLKQAAAIGSAKAALLVVHHYAPDDVTIICPRVVEPDEDMAMIYMVRAIREGYDAQTKSFRPDAL